MIFQGDARPWSRTGTCVEPEDSEPALPPRNREVSRLEPRVWRHADAAVYIGPQDPLTSIFSASRHSWTAAWRVVGRKCGNSAEPCRYGVWRPCSLGHPIVGLSDAEIIPPLWSAHRNFGNEHPCAHEFLRPTQHHPIVLRYTVPPLGIRRNQSTGTTDRLDGTGSPITPPVRRSSSTAAS